MKWSLLSLKQAETFSGSYQLDWALPMPIAFAVEEPFSWLIPSQEETFPVCFFTLAELQTVGAWETILKQQPVHRIDLARYSARHPEIPAGVFLECLGIKQHYQNMALWQELAGFDELTREMAKLYDFPVHTLRLWDRIPEKFRRAWLELWQQRNVKKNLIREIITDFYDLSPAGQERALEDSVRWSENWKAVSRNFPAFEIRNLVRRQRYPQVERLRDRLKGLKRGLDAPKNSELHLPEHLESRRIELSLSFDSVAQLKAQLSFFGEEQTVARIEEILDLL